MVCSNFFASVLKEHTIVVRAIHYTKVKNKGDTFILCRLGVEDMVCMEGKPQLSFLSLCPTFLVPFCGAEFGASLFAARRHTWPVFTFRFLCNQLKSHSTVYSALSSPLVTERVN